MAVVVGIDPGLDGALAFCGPVDGSWVEDMPTVEEKAGKKRRRHIDAATLANMLRFNHEDHNVVYAIIERVWSSPQQGVVSAFSMGEGLGIVLGVLAALGIPVVRVVPAEWKRRAGLPPKATKEDSRAAALRLFPSLAKDLGRKKDHGRAEALLICKFGVAP